MVDSLKPITTFGTGLFTGKTAIVTGGTSGIGLACADMLAVLGAAVTAVGFNADEATALSNNTGIVFHELDVTDTVAVNKLIDNTSRLDILVNCAGITKHREEYDLAAFEHVIAVNLTATMKVSHAAFAKLKIQGGSIVNIASMFSYFGSRDRPAYSASKGAIVQLTKSLAQEYAADGVRVNAVAPGWIDTPLSKGLMADAIASKAILDRTPLSRWGKSSEIASAVSFFMLAGGYIHYGDNLAGRRGLFHPIM